MKTDTALVIGNGPSVDRLDPTVFDHVTTYGCNHLGRKFAVWGRSTDHIVITDSNRIAEIRDAYLDFPGSLWVGHQQYMRAPYGWIRRHLGRDFQPLRQLPRKGFPARWPFDRLPWPKQLQPLVFDKLRFSFDWQEGLNFGYSVTISAIQIAVLNGARRVLLTGVDTSYETPKAYFSGMADQIQYVNQTFIKNPRLFMEPVLVNLQICLETLGVELVDCTPGGRLKFIAKGELDALIRH